jgi:hypothetical protein
MGVISVYETFDGRSSSLNDQRERNYTRTFNVICDTRLTDSAVVRIAPGIPRLWSPYITPTGGIDRGSWCRNVEVRQDAACPELWRATVSYSSQLTRPDLNLLENPLLRPLEIEWSGTDVMIPMEYDADGEAILNSAGELFDPPPETEDSRIVLKITRNLAVWDALDRLKYRKTVNTQRWFGFAAGQVLCNDMRGSRGFENGLYYWKESVEFHIRTPRFEVLNEETNEYELEAPADVWKLRILDRGLYERVGGKLQIALDRLGRPVSQPVIFNGAGRKLTAGDPTYLQFQRYRRRDFNLLIPGY